MAGRGRGPSGDWKYDPRKSSAGPMLRQHPEGNVQLVNGSNKRPSKWKDIVPTSAADLEKHAAGKYSFINERQRRMCSSGDNVLVVFINRQDVWVQIEEREDDEICGRIINKVTRVEGLQIGQLVRFSAECIVTIDDSDSDDD